VFGPKLRNYSSSVAKYFDSSFDEFTDDSAAITARLGGLSMFDFSKMDDHASDKSRCAASKSGDTDSAYSCDVAITASSQGLCQNFDGVILTSTSRAFSGFADDSYLHLPHFKLF
jgi:hypothetical protein